MTGWSRASQLELLLCPQTRESLTLTRTCQNGCACFCQQFLEPDSPALNLKARREVFRIGDSRKCLVTRWLALRSCKTALRSPSLLRKLPRAQGTSCWPRQGTGGAAGSQAGALTEWRGRKSRGLACRWDSPGACVQGHFWRSRCKGA